MDDPDINALVKRLSRPHPSGGVVIERAAILAAGADFPQVMDWITGHAGAPETTETTASPARSGGLYGSRLNEGNDASARKPLRFVLPAGTLS